MKIFSPLLIAVSALMLGSCGGGSDTGNSQGNQQSALAVACAASLDGIATLADGSATVGKPAAATVFGCAGALRAVKWTQTGGDILPLYGERMQAISFEPPAAGTYTFHVDVTDASGIARSSNVSINATAGMTTSTISARADQFVFGGSDVSLRAWPTLATGDAVTSVSWAQIDGPTVTLQAPAADSTLLQFKAPLVSRDELFKFRVTLRTAAGTTDADDAWVVVSQKNATAAAGGGAFFEGIKVSPVHAYKFDGAYAAALPACVYSIDISAANVCPFSKLPLIGQQAAGQLPTVEQVMDHVVVSHDWMGANFETFLRTQDVNGDLRRLLGSVTAIVIGSHVRPSFYYFPTGAIYLDAENLWLNPAERDVINEAPDYRSSFGSELHYAMPWRYVVNNNNARVGFPKTRRIARSVDYLTYELGDLLYHELAHANDFLPSSTRANLSLQTNPYQAVSASTTRGSNVLTSASPLLSQEMFGLGRVNFAGAAASAVQKAYMPADITRFFSPDQASDEYNFSSQYEDFAMLFEEYMMFYRHNVRRDVAVTGPFTSTTTGSNLIVDWGQRSRVTETAIKPRLKIVLQQMAPWLDPNVIDTLGSPIAMRAGQSWNANLILQAPLGQTVAEMHVAELANADEINHTLRKMAERRAAAELQHETLKKFAKAGNKY